MLKVTDLVVRYGHVTAVWGVSLDVAPREIVTLIGANGAGKTSIIKAIAGLLPPFPRGVYMEEVRDDGSSEWKDLHARAQRGGVHDGARPR